MRWLTVIFRLHKESKERSKELQAMSTLGFGIVYIVSLIIKCFRLITRVHKLKSYLFTKYCQSTISLCNGTPQICTPPPLGAVQVLYTYTSVLIAMSLNKELNLGILQLLQINSFPLIYYFSFYQRKIKGFPVYMYQKGTFLKKL